MAIVRRNKSKEALVRRAHLGNVSNADELINLAIKNNISTQPLDVEGLCKLLNIDVAYADDLSADVSGKLTKTETGWLCIVNANHHSTRQRFTIAHELAHYILHRNQQSNFIDSTYFRKEDSINTMEYEANAFAADLLMPRASFQYFTRNISNDINKVAAHFGVSPLAVSVRSKQLNGGV